MSDPMILAIAIAAGLLLFWAIYKVVKAIVFAIVASVLVGAAIFYYLPRMEPTSGKLEEVRQQAVKITDELKAHSQDITENIKTVSKSIGDVATKADQLLNDTAQAQKTAKDLQETIEKDTAQHQEKTGAQIPATDQIKSLGLDDHQLKNLSQGIQDLQNAINSP